MSASSIVSAVRCLGGGRIIDNLQIDNWQIDNQNLLIDNLKITFISWFKIDNLSFCFNLLLFNKN